MKRLQTWGHQNFVLAFTPQAMLHWSIGSETILSKSQSSAG